MNSSPPATLPPSDDAMKGTAGWAWNALLHETAEKVFIPADAGIQLVVLCLDSAGFLKAALGEGAWEQRDRSTHGQDALGIIGCNCRGRADSKAIGDGPVLGGLHQPVLLESTIKGWGVGAPCKRRHCAVFVGCCWLCRGSFWCTLVLVAISDRDPDNGRQLPYRH